MPSTRSFSIKSRAECTGVEYLRNPLGGKFVSRIVQQRFHVLDRRGETRPLAATAPVFLCEKLLIAKTSHLASPATISSALLVAGEATLCITSGLLASNARIRRSTPSFVVSVALTSTPVSVIVTRIWSTSTRGAKISMQALASALMRLSGDFPAVFITGGLCPCDSASTNANVSLNA